MRGKKPSQAEIALFLRLFATLISTGIAIDTACDTLLKNNKSNLHILIHTLKRNTLRGKNLHESFIYFSNIFNPITCQLVYIGEHTGQLAEMLLIAANYYEKNWQTSQAIKQTLFYPFFLLITALLLLFGMFIFVLPRFAELFKDHLEDLPLFTKILFFVSDKLNQNLTFILLFLVISIISFKILFPRILVFLNQGIFKIKSIRLYSEKLVILRFSRHLALTLKAGVPILASLELLSKAYLNTPFFIIIRQIKIKLNQGMNLHQSMLSLMFFPSLLIQMVKVGEETGKLDIMLNKYVELSENELAASFKRLSQLLEPLIMLILGALIGGLVIGMYLPIFRLGSTL